MWVTPYFFEDSPPPFFNLNIKTTSTQKQRGNISPNCPRFLQNQKIKKQEEIKKSTNNTHPQEEKIQQTTQKKKKKKRKRRSFNRSRCTRSPCGFQGLGLGGGWRTQPFDLCTVRTMGLGAAEGVSWEKVKGGVQGSWNYPYWRDQTMQTYGKL